MLLHMNHRWGDLWAPRVIFHNSVRKVSYSTDYRNTMPSHDTNTVVIYNVEAILTDTLIENKILGTSGNPVYYSEILQGWDMLWMPFDKRTLVVVLHILDVGFPTGMQLQWHPVWRGAQITAQEDMSKMLPPDWYATSDFTLAIGDFEGFGKASLAATLDIERNAGTWFSTVILPVYFIQAMGLASLFVPPKMCMPRVALALLALVSVSAMSRTIQTAVPPGQITWLGEFLGNIVVCMCWVCVMHIWIFYLSGKKSVNADTLEAAVADVVKHTRLLFWFNLCQPLVIPTLSCALAVAQPHSLILNPFLSVVLGVLQWVWCYCKFTKAIQASSIGEGGIAEATDETTAVARQQTWLETNNLADPGGGEPVHINKTDASQSPKSPSTEQMLPRSQSTGAAETTTLSTQQWL